MKIANADTCLSDGAGVLNQSNVSLGLRNIQFVDDLVDPLLDQFEVLRTHALRAVDQEHYVCRCIAASW